MRHGTDEDGVTFPVEPPLGAVGRERGSSAGSPWNEEADVSLVAWQTAPPTRPLPAGSRRRTSGQPGAGGGFLPADVPRCPHGRGTRCLGDLRAAARGQRRRHLPGSRWEGCMTVPGPPVAVGEGNALGPRGRGPGRSGLQQAFTGEDALRSPIAASVTNVRGRSVWPPYSGSPPLLAHRPCSGGDFCRRQESCSDVARGTSGNEPGHIVRARSCRSLPITRPR